MSAILVIMFCLSKYTPAKYDTDGHNIKQGDIV